VFDGTIGKDIADLLLVSLPILILATLVSFGIEGKPNRNGTTDPHWFTMFLIGLAVASITVGGFLDHIATNFDACPCK
jgi:hypothetical protein